MVRCDGAPADCPRAMKYDSPRGHAHCATRGTFNTAARDATIAVVRSVQIIPHEGTSDAAAAAAVSVGGRQGKTCIVVKDVPGFYVNR